MRGDYAQSSWRYFTFANWTWSDRDDAARIRADWPTWRKAIRPIGAGAWWAGIIIGFFTNESRTAASFVLLVVVLLCVAYGIFDGIVTRRARKHRPGPRPRPGPGPGPEGALSASGCGLAR